MILHLPFPSILSFFLKFLFYFGVDESNGEKWGVGGVWWIVSFIVSIKRRYQMLVGIPWCNFHLCFFTLFGQRE